MSNEERIECRHGHAGCDACVDRERESVALKDALAQAERERDDMKAAAVKHLEAFQIQHVEWVGACEERDRARAELGKLRRAYDERHGYRGKGRWPNYAVESIRAVEASNTKLRTQLAEKTRREDAALGVIANSLDLIALIRTADWGPTQEEWEQAARRWIDGYGDTRPAEEDGEHGR